MDRARKLVILIFICLLNGCAINDIGTVKLRFFANESVRMVSKESWGAYLNTDSSNAGLTLGHAEVILFYPKHNNSLELELDELFTKIQQAQLMEITEKEWSIPDMEPIAWISNKQGLMLHTNQFRLGISLGIDKRHVIRLPRDFNGIFAFRSTADGKFKAFYHESLH